MSGAEVEPLEDIQSSSSEGPVDEGLQLEDKWDGHEAFESDIVHYVIAVHQEVSFLHFGDAVSYLKGANPEVAAIEDIEDDEGPVVSKFITVDLVFLFVASLRHAVRKGLQFDVPSNWKVPEDEGMHKQQKKQLEIVLGDHR